MKTMVLDYKNKPGMREACEDDVRALCGEDGAEGGDYANTVDCLKDQKDKGAPGAWSARCMSGAGGVAGARLAAEPRSSAPAPPTCRQSAAR
ncbi:unnamed protein product [Heterosigma akashiwo]